MVERGHKPFVDGLTKASLRLNVGWADNYLFHSALWADRVSVKRTTGYTPYVLRFGQECILPIDVLF